MLSTPLTANILVIDDDPVLVQEITEYFEDNGFSIIPAESGEQGLALIETEKPMLVVTDLQLPGISGLEVLRKITKEYPELPVVVISEPEGLDDVIQALRIGAWEYLTKPITEMSVLEHGVCRALERARLIEQNRIYAKQLEEANQALKKNLATLQEDQVAGRSVQKQLLPSKEVTFSQYAFSHNVAPSLYLSGDFVDYFKISEGVLGVYLADVSGHGSSSAFVTVLLKSLMSNIVTRYQAGKENTILEPNQVLAEISREIYAAKLGKYLTMVYGVIRCEDNSFCYSVGGHYPNPVMLQNAKATFLTGKGFPVGIMAKATFESQSITIEPGAKLLFFSDGIAEILSGNDMAAKEQQLLSMIEEGQGRIRHFIEALNLDEQAELPDDVTILSLHHDASLT